MAGTLCAGRGGAHPTSLASPLPPPLPIPLQRDDHGQRDLHQITAVVHHHRRHLHIPRSERRARRCPEVQRLGQHRVGSRRSHQHTTPRHHPQPVAHRIHLADRHAEQHPSGEDVEVHHHVQPPVLRGHRQQLGAVQHPQATHIHQRSHRGEHQYRHHSGAQQPHQTTTHPACRAAAHQQRHRPGQRHQQRNHHAHEHVAHHVRGELPGGHRHQQGHHPQSRTHQGRGAPQRPPISPPPQHRDRAQADQHDPAHDAHHDSRRCSTVVSGHRDSRLLPSTLHNSPPPPTSPPPAAPAARRRAPRSPPHPRPPTAPKPTSTPPPTMPTTPPGVAAPW